MVEAINSVCVCVSVNVVMLSSSITYLLILKRERERERERQSERVCVRVFVVERGGKDIMRLDFHTNSVF